MEKTDIQKFYSGQTIFVTGGTGFLGKLLIEKLLRSCYDLRKMYMLVRPKKGKSEIDRFNELFETECFGPLKKEYPNFKEKISLIYGDCLQPNLGLKEESKNSLMQEVTSIFHIAATVRFDQHLRAAAYINVRSVIDLLKMAKEMPQFRAFVHVSTAYSNCTQSYIEEKFYDPPMSAESLLRLVGSLDDETISEITPKIIKEWPNTYVFTKCIAESAIQELENDLPIAVVRPAIVSMTAREPLVGWVDNFYGVNGIIAGAALGIIRTMPAVPNNKAEVIPVDFVINNVLAAGWALEHNRHKFEEKSEIPIYNYVLTTFVAFTWAKLFDVVYGQRWLYPSVKSIWVPNWFDLRPGPIQHELAIFFLHTIPAHIIDVVLLCMGKKKIAVEAYKKVRKFLDVTAYFGRKEWEFDSNNVKQLLSMMSPKDREIFDFDISNYDFEEILINGIKGGRVYLVKDPLDTIPLAKKKQIKFMIAHYIICGILLLFLIQIVLFMCKIFF